MQATRLQLIALAVAIVFIAVHAYYAATHGKKETFSLGNIFKKAVQGVATGINAVVNTGKNVVNNIKGGGDSKYTPSFVGRQFNGFDWQCPDGTIDTGRADHEACLNSDYMYPLWRWDGKQWSHSCPNGTAPTTSSTWEMKCERGWVGRVNMNGKYQCPAGTWDSGKDWNNSSWHDAHKQCKVSSAYTTRMWDGKQWVCPPNTKDSGRNWGMAGGEKQCKYNAG